MTLLLNREALILGTDRELRRQHASGNLHRLRPGVYIASSTWAEFDPDARYRAIVAATASVLPLDTQFSHDSAAALWRLPSLTSWPDVAHVTREPLAGGRSRVGVRHHGLGLDPNPFTIDDVTVTSLARTLLDAASGVHFTRAVAMVDAGLRKPQKGDFLHTLGVRVPSRDELLRLHEARMPYFCSARVSRVLEFCDGRSGSPSESFFRCQTFALGLPAPELQVAFYDEEGFIGVVDFYWPHLGLIVEIDGESKYSARRRYQRDMTLEQIVLAEKKREDRLRRVVQDFARPPMSIVRDRRKLAIYLSRHGLVPVGR